MVLQVEKVDRGRDGRAILFSARGGCSKAPAG